MPDFTESEQKAARQRYEDIAKQIEREDGLINTRTTWLLASEALLLGGVGLLATKAAEKDVLTAQPGIAALLLLGAAVLLALGAIVASRCGDAIAAASAQLSYLRTCWDASPFLKRTYVPPFGDLTAHSQGIDYPVKLAKSFFWFSWAGVCIFAVLALWPLHLWYPRLDARRCYELATGVLLAGVFGAVLSTKLRSAAVSAHPSPGKLDVDVRLQKESAREAAQRRPKP
jgi:hypothetical protein